MDKFTYNSPPDTPVKRMINPTPRNTAPLQRLPELPPWLQDKSGTAARQRPIPDARTPNTDRITPGVPISQLQVGRIDPETSLRQALGSGSRPDSTNVFAPRVPFPPPREGRVDWETSMRQMMEPSTRSYNSNLFATRAPVPGPQEGRVEPEKSLRQVFETPRNRNKGKSAVRPSSSQLQLETPTTDVDDAESAYYSSSPVPSPRVRATEWSPTPTTRLRERAPSSFATAERPPAVIPVEEAPGRKAVHFRNTPDIYQVERTGWRPVSEQRRRRHNNRRFRIVEVDRPPIFPESVKRVALGLLPWAFWIAVVAVVVGVATRFKGSAPIVQPDLRPRIPPDFYFTHREFRKLTPEKAPAYEYLSKAGEAGMIHLKEVIRLNKEAKNKEKIASSQEKDWHALTRQLDLVKTQWDNVLRSVFGADKELIAQSTNWYDTKAAAQSTLHSPRMASLAANDRRKAREGWLEDIRSAASFSAKAIENQARFVNLSLDKADRNVDLFLPTGCGPWESILLGAEFEKEKPQYLARLPSVYASIAPSWTSKWLERKRRRLQFCASLLPHLAYFQDYVRIVILSNEHLRDAAREVKELTDVDDPAASFEDMSPASVIVTSEEIDLPINSSASPDEGAAKTAKTPSYAEKLERNQTSTTPIFATHTSWVSGYRASVKRWGENLSRFFLGFPEWKSAPDGSEDAHEKLSPTRHHASSTEDRTVNEGEQTCPITNNEYMPPADISPIQTYNTDGDEAAESGHQECQASGETVSTVTIISWDSDTVSVIEGVVAQTDRENYEPSPLDIPVSTENDAAQEVDKSTTASTSTISGLTLHHNSNLVKAAQEAEEKRRNRPAPVTIDDIFRAWDRIVGGISSVIDREFRT